MSVAEFLEIWWVFPASVVFATVAQGMDYATARWIRLGAVPFALAGALVAHEVAAGVLRGIFGFGLVGLSGFLLLQRAPEVCEPGEKAGEMMRRKSAGSATTVIEARDGAVYEYPTCWRLPRVALAAVGGAITGLVSAGLPEISTTQLVVRCLPASWRGCRAECSPSWVC